MAAARARERARGTVARGRLVELRPPRAGDGPELPRVNRASARRHRGRARPPRTAAEFARYLARSRKVAGRWRDHERWALLRESWRARSRALRRGERA